MQAGLAVFNRGVNRFWVRGNVLANVLACGITGRDFGTRAQPQMYIKDYDLRLRGSHVICYAVYPHEGNWMQARVPREALSYRHPLRVTVADGDSGPESESGVLPSELSFARLDADQLVPTALFARGDSVVCRLFETTGTAAQLEMACRDGWRVRCIRSLAGDPIGAIGPFGIAEAEMRM
jgi:alpha-mannosidase